MRTRRTIENRVRQAGEHLGDEVRRAVTFMDEEVVPEIRRHSSGALRSAGDRLRELADILDDEPRRREGRER